MKSGLMGFTALAALAATGAAAADQAPATPTPAGQSAAPQPTVQEELVYLRDIIALQTLRLDEAEQALARQTKALNDQQKRIAELERALANGQGRAVLAADMKGDYTVRSGDTLGLIAQRHGVSLSDLAAANGLKSPYRIAVGQRLAVPGAAPAEDASAAAKVAARPDEKQKPIAVASADPPGPSPESRPDVTERALSGEQKPASAATPQEVGVRPQDEDDRPQVAVLPDVGGILTPKGAFYVEPSFDYTVTSDNRFFFQGVEIVDAILIGVIEATDSDRRGRTASLAARYGITDRLEVDGRVSWVNRNDRISGVAIDDGTTIFRELNGGGLGDAEVGVHYQLTDGRGFPFTILNLRAKAPTGDGPFDVSRDAKGIETELATGSGFWSIEPSVTFILPTDPAVIFANVGYQMNLSDSPDALIGPNTIVREFNPGDAIRASIGLGLAINDRFSVSFGYDQSNFFRTSTLLESVATGAQSVTRQQPTAVGSFLVGGSYTLNDRVRLNLNTAFGATDEAPDMRVSLRAQVRLFD